MKIEYYFVLLLAFACNNNSTNELPSVITEEAEVSIEDVDLLARNALNELIDNTDLFVSPDWEGYSLDTVVYNRDLPQIHWTKCLKGIKSKEGMDKFEYLIKGYSDGRHLKYSRDSLLSREYVNIVREGEKRDHLSYLMSPLSISDSNVYVLFELELNNRGEGFLARFTRGMNHELKFEESVSVYSKY